MRDRLSPITLIVLLIATIALLLAVSRNTRHQYFGDEPHYLVMAGSLVLDGDLDLKNDYDLKRYENYFGGELTPHLAPGKLPEDEPPSYSIHGSGMGYLLAPLVSALAPFAGDINPLGADITMAIIGFAVLLLVYFWSRRVTQSETAAVISVAILLMSSFFGGIYGFIYPDLILAFFALSALILIDAKPTTLRWLALGCVFALVPWFHFKSLIMVFFLGLWAIIATIRSTVSLRERISLITALLAPVVFSLVTMSVVFHSWYNVWLPNQIYSYEMVGDKVVNGLFGVSPFVSIPAMLFDATKGLLVFNPAFWLVLVGAPIAYVVARRYFFLILTAVIPVFATIVVFNDWPAGFAPTGRYLMEFLPVVVPLAGLVIARNLKSIGIWLFTILLLSWHAFLGYLLVFGNGIAYPAGPAVFILGEPNPSAQKLSELTGITLSNFTPLYGTFALSSGGQWLGLYIALVVLFLGLGFLLAKKELHIVSSSSSR